MPAKAGIHDLSLPKIPHAAIALTEWPPSIELPRKVRDARGNTSG
jgi:hypothetical protein